MATAPDARRPSVLLRPPQLYPRIKENLWQQARDLLEDGDKKGLELPQGKVVFIVDDVLEEVKKGEKKCADKMWKIHTRKGDITFRELFQKVAYWVTKFKEAGDQLVQYDPGHAALPWAGIRILLQVAISDSETYSSMAHGVVFVSSMVTRYAIFESLYLLETSSARVQLIEDLVKLYVAVLRYLTRARHYYSKSTPERMVKSIVTSSQHTIQDFIDSIKQQQVNVDRTANLVAAELQRSGEINARETAKEVAELRKKSEELLSKLDPIEEMAHEFFKLSAQMQDRERREKRTKVLSWLSTVSYTEHHRNVSKDLVEKTGTWLLERRDYLNWLRSPGSKTLWLHGIVGCGKTRLVSVLIESFLTARASYNEAEPVAFFYCNASEDSRTRPEEILRAIAKQLALTGLDEPLHRALREKYEEREKNAEKEGQEYLPPLTIKESTRLIVDLLAAPTTVLIIDALDECFAKARPVLLRAFHEIVQESRNDVKILISGRDDVRSDFQTANFPSDIQISAKDNSEDIAKYITSEVESAVSEGRLKSELKSLMIQKLKEGANGMFLWVNLTIQYLCDRQRMKVAADVKRELSRLSPEISVIYRNIHQQIMDSGEYSRSVGKAVFKWLLCAKRPLSVQAMIEAVSTIDDDGELVILTKDEILQVCANLVVVDSELNIFRVAHVSVQEYLEKEVPDYTQTELHSFAALRCLEEFSSERQELRKQAASSASGSSSFHSYSVVYWDHHYALVEIRSADLEKKVCGFLFDTDRFGTFNREARSNAERRDLEYPDYSKSETPIPKPEYYGKQIVASPATPLFAICTLGLKGFEEDLEDIEGLNWSQPNDDKNTGLHLAAAYGHLHIVHYLITKVEPDLKGNHDKTPLHYAAEWGQKDIGGFLLEQNNVIVDAVDENGETALHIAAGYGYDQFAQLLLTKGADVNARSTTSSTPLLGAATFGHRNLVRLLLRAKADIKAADNDGFTALHRTIEHGERDFEAVAKLLLEKGADLESEDKEGQRALHLAAKFQRANIVQQLISRKAEVNAKTYSGKTPLDFAAAKCAKKIIEILLKNKATLEADNYGRTELHEAVEGGCDVEVLQLFLDRKADVNAQTDDGQTALEFAARHKDSPHAFLVVQRLLDAGAAADVTNSRGETMLHHAAYGGSEEITRLLLDKVIEIEMQNMAGETALLVAARSGSDKIASLLLEHGSDPKSVDGDGNTLLHCSVSGGSELLVKLVVKLNVIDVTATNFSNDSALDLAAQSGHMAICRFLLENGAAISPKDTNEDAADPTDTVLHRAVKSSMSSFRTTLVELLIEAGANVHAVGAQGWSVLQAAIEQDNCDDSLVKLLLSKGAKTSAQDLEGNTPLHTAATKGRDSTFELLMLNSNEADLNVKNKLGQTPLVFAAWQDNLSIVSRLLEGRVDANLKTKDGQTALMYAAGYHHDVVEELLSNGEVEIDLQDEKGQTALIFAAANGQLDIVKLLLNHPGTTAGQVDNEGRDAASYAAENGYLAIIELLLGRTDTDAQLVDNYGRNQISRASEHGHEKVIRCLFERFDAPATGQDKEQRDALSYASELGHEKVVRFLLEEAGVEVNAKDNRGKSALNYAATRTDEIILNMLLSQQGIEVDSRDNTGDTPLRTATTYGHASIAKLLICAGADVNSQSDDGTPILNAVAYNRLETTLLYLLENSEVDASKMDSMGRTTLSYAAEYGMEKVCRVLLSRKDVSAATGTNSTPLHYAVINCDEVIFDLLLDRPEVDPDARNSVGRTPLREAVNRSYISIARKLLQRNVEVDTVADDGMTALHMAAIFGDASVISLLLDHGAVIQLDETLQALRKNVWADSETTAELEKRLCEAGAVESGDWLGMWNSCAPEVGLRIASPDLDSTNAIPNDLAIEELKLETDPNQSQPLDQKEIEQGDKSV